MAAEKRNLLEQPDLTLRNETCSHSAICANRNNLRMLRQACNYIVAGANRFLNNTDNILPIK